MTNEQYEAAKELFLHQKKSLTKIEQELGVCRKKLSKRLKEDGLYRGKSYTTTQLEEAKTLLEQGQSITSICQLLNVDRFAFSRFLRENGVLEARDPMSNCNNRYDYNAPWVDDLIEDYKNKVDKRELLKKYNVSEQAYYNILRYKKVSRTNNKIHGISNEDAFEVIDTEEKAYWLGFLYADGYINETMSHVELTLQKQDKKHVERFKEFIGSEAPIKDREIEIGGKIYHSSRFTISSKKMVNDLVDKGCHQKKSLTLLPPSIHEDLIPHFIRGYMDGDGCVCYSCGRVSVSFVGTKELLDWIVSNTNTRRNKYRPQGRALSYTFSSKNEVKQFFHYIYDNATIYMERKKNKFVLPSIVNVNKSNDGVLGSKIGEVVQ